MLTVIAMPITCCLCALLAIPRRPAAGNEVAELVYARLRSRHQRITLVALITTAATFFIVIGVAILSSFNP